MDRTVAAASALIACLALSGCGGGSGFDDGDGGGDGPPPPPPPTTQYVAPADNVFLSAIDPTNATTATAPPLGTYAGARLFTTGTIVAGSPYLANQADYAQIYKASDGHIHRLDLVVAGTPSMEQVSSESNATTDDLCSLNGASTALGTDVNYLAVQFYNDFANPENSVYFYRLPGPDGVCNTSDDVVYMVKLAMGSGDAPILARMPMAVVHDPASGAIKGFIVNESTALTMYDENFQNRTVLETPSSPIGVAYTLATAGFTSTGGLFVVDGNIVHIDYVAQAVSASLFAIPNWTPTIRFPNSASPTTAYFSVNTSNMTQKPVVLTSALYSMPLDGSATPALLSSESSGVINQVTIPVGGTEVAYSIVPPGGVYTVRSVVENNGQPSVTTAVTTTGNSGSFFATAADIYYTVSTVSSPSSTSRLFSNTLTGIVGMDGTVIEPPVADSRFIATQRDTSGSGWLNVIRARDLSPVTLVSNTNGLTYTEDGISGSTLEVVDTASNSITLTLGTLPQGTIMSGSGTLTGTAGYIDGLNVNSTMNPSTRELMYVNTSTAGSLGMVTSNLH